MHNVAKIVCNTGPLIALAKINLFHLLKELFEAVSIPEAVLREVQDEVSQSALTSAGRWLRIHQVRDRLSVQLLQADLDAGESEAIVLAAEIHADLLIIDERSATFRARNLQLQTTGTLGLLLIAKDRALISQVKPVLDDLRRTNFHMSEALYREVLASANEVDL